MPQQLPYPGCPIGLLSAANADTPTPGGTSITGSVLDVAVIGGNVASVVASGSTRRDVIGRRADGTGRENADGAVGVLDAGVVSDIGNGDAALQNDGVLLPEADASPCSGGNGLMPLRVSVDLRLRCTGAGRGRAGGQMGGCRVGWGKPEHTVNAFHTTNSPQVATTDYSGHGGARHCNTATARDVTTPTRYIQGVGTGIWRASDGCGGWQWGDRQRARCETKRRAEIGSVDAPPAPLAPAASTTDWAPAMHRQHTALQYRGGGNVRIAVPWTLVVLRFRRRLVDGRLSEPTRQTA